MKIISKDRLYNIVGKFETIAPILVIGDIGVDKYTSGVVRRISPEAPVPVLEVTKEWLKLGLSANVSHNLSTLEVKNNLVGAIGEDRNGDVLVKLLDDCKINQDGVIRVNNRPTTFKERIITNTQQICRVDYETLIELDISSEKNIISFLDRTISKYSSVIIEDYGKGTLTAGVIAHVIAVARQNKIPVMVDPSRTTNPKMYKGATLLKPNRQEAELMVHAMGFKNTNIDEIGAILQRELEIEQIVITLGGEGMAIFKKSEKSRPVVIPTVATEVFDVSGAGDTTICLLAASIAAGASLEEASWIANCGAGIVVGKHGTATVNQQELFSYHEKIEHFFAKDGVV